MGLPEHLESKRRNVSSKGEVNFDVGTVTSANIYRCLGVDNSWDHEAWKKEFQVDVKWMKGKDMEFDLINIDPAITNALRRILIAEVPTVAFEHIFFVNNTSIIPDEILAHRLGLVPLNIDPDLLEWKSAEDPGTERNTVVFRLKIHCRIGENGMVNEHVYASDFEWRPEGSDMPEETSCSFANSQTSILTSPPTMLHDDILLAKMRPGQCIDLEAHAIKGVGSDHAKWSPVATAWYRLQPEVKIKGKIKGSDARQLVETCRGLFALGKDKKGEEVAKVTKARGNELHLEKLRHMISDEKWAKNLELLRKKEHMIFTIQSAGFDEPDTLFCKAINGLISKCDAVLERI